MFTSLCPHLVALVSALCLLLSGAPSVSSQENETVEACEDCCSHIYTHYYDYDIYIIRNEADLGKNITLSCSGENLPTPPCDAVPVQWMMPDLSRVPTNYSDEKVEVSEDGYNLTVFNVWQEDFGLYHCMMQYNNSQTHSTTWWLVKVGINTEGPYYEDLWEKYRMNTIIGLSAFFGFLLLVLLVWLPYRFRWQGDEEEYDSDLDVYTGTQGYNAYQGYGSSGETNAGFQGDKAEKGEGMHVDGDVTKDPRDDNYDEKLRSNDEKPHVEVYPVGQIGDDEIESTAL